MISIAETAVIHGIEAIPVRVETVISRGMPVFTVVGLADTMVREAKDRIRAAITGSGMEFPLGRITMNMAPADIRKRGSHMDLAMAVGILAASKQILSDEMKEYSFIGELSLDGRVSHVRGILPMITALKKHGIKKMIVPESGAREAALVDGIEIYPAKTLEDVAAHFNRKKRLPDIYEEAKARNAISLSELDCAHADELDFADVRGQEYAKRAAVIAAAGGHGMLMVGSPSTGKTMIAERISGILPAMTGEEQLRATVIHSVAGKLAPDMPVITKRPFRHPHHRITSAGLIGGGATPRPGEITLASGGVLFTGESPNLEPERIEKAEGTTETRAFWASGLLPYGKGHWDARPGLEICTTGWGEYVTRYVANI